MSKATAEAITNNQQNQKSIAQQLLNVALIGGACYLAYRIADELIEQYKKEQAEKNLLKKPEVIQAEQFLAAMNPSFAWLKHIDGTKEEAIFETAKSITNLNGVIDEYKKLTGGKSLIEDLRIELTPEEFTKFLNTVKFSPNNPNKTTNTSQLKFRKGSLIATKLDTNVRKSPKNISRYGMKPNLVKTVVGGRYLGVATGKSEFDSDGKSNTGTLFIELQIVVSDTGKIIYLWAAASQLQIISYADYKAGKYPNADISKKYTLSGFTEGYQSSQNHSQNHSQNRLITTKQTDLYNEKLQHIGQVEPLKILGFLIMELNNNKGQKLLQFLDAENQKYWIKADAVHVY